MTAPDFLILGGSGQLARAFRALSNPDAQFSLSSLQRPELDLLRPDSAAEVLQRHLDRLDRSPAAVINTAAYTAVDQAESDVTAAKAVNEQSPGLFAKICAERNIPLVHYSTDYIFDGSGKRPWLEVDPPGPLGVYGCTKLAGEKRVSESGAKYLIFRTSWVFDADGKNFFNTVLRLARTREHLRIVADQFGSPTYAPHLAQLSLDALQSALNMTLFPSGVYHLSNSGVTSWHGFARTIAEEARGRNILLRIGPEAIEPIRSDEYATPAQRPKNSRLDLGKFIAIFGLVPPPWEDGVKACFELWDPQRNS